MSEITIDNIAVGDVILVDHKGVDLQSLCIKVDNYFKLGYKDRGWTHSALYIGDGKIVEALTSGIHTADLKKSYLNGDYSVLILRHRNASSDALNKAVDFCKNENGGKYDFRALIYFLLFDLTPPPIHYILDNNYIGGCFNVYNSYFCSELIATGFQKANVYCFEEEPYKVLPVDFNNSLLFEEVARIEVPINNNEATYKLKSFLFNILYFIFALFFILLIFIIGIGIILLIGSIFIMPILKSIKSLNSEVNRK